MMTTLSNAQMSMLVERFVGEIADGAAIDDAWRRRMVEVSTPELPDDPTPGQIEAWNELAEMLADQSFVAEMQAEMAGMWNDDFDPAAYRAAAEHIHEIVRDAMARGVDPVSDEGRAIGRDWLERSAMAMRRAPDADFLGWHLAQYGKHHGRTARYRDLLAILHGQPAEPSSANEWTWMSDALAALRPEFV